ncbi:MAG: undecaprenyl/decaprenyl-phosphate alpha-N-acetylglucosaminyl 1-phosphate transferase [Fimbriimonadaceae bacterium]|nr:undecaprenyl/decaprenyl-phosphate alpha-N-acetylglucosaminyl 1-phosphate transferase [Chthonomonadaceae bacterium]MCO5296553.1 undecaprenyl/decaprenyl-phosphate alpha-N-acetylglucosaminyl 1-phosphate transferase [Fimbriimonadaceae bacterium]
MMDLLDWVAQEHAKPLAGFRAPLMTGAIALTVTYFLTPFVRSLAIRKGVIDDPKSDDRRVHTEPTPRWGGLAIFVGIAAALAVVLPFAFPLNPFPRYLQAMLVASLLIVVMGALDDLYQFRASVQALFLLTIGVCVQYWFGDAGRVQIPGMGNPLAAEGGWIDFGWAAVPITAIYLFVVTKTMDTIDGIDGLAAGIAAIAGGTLSVIATYFVLDSNPQRAAELGRALWQDLPRIAIIAAALAGAAIGFLKHNYNPAKIFMGTGGAQLLGFLLACLSIVGVMKTAAALALLVPVLVFGVPIVDAVNVVIRRLASRQPITQADKRHLHHQLLERGLTQRQAVWVLYLVALTLCGVLLVVVRLYG